MRTIVLLHRVKSNAIKIIKIFSLDPHLVYDFIIFDFNYYNFNIFK
jgi:hypothetical protein